MTASWVNTGRIVGPPGPEGPQGPPATLPDTGTLIWVQDAEDISSNVAIQWFSFANIRPGRYTVEIYGNIVAGNLMFEWNPLPPGATWTARVHHTASTTTWNWSSGTFASAWLTTPFTVVGYINIPVGGPIGMRTSPSGTTTIRGSWARLMPTDHGDLIGPPGLPGAPGAPGPQGLAGVGINVRGRVASQSELPPSGESQGDAYFADDTGHTWVWGGQALPGVPGPPGPQGPIGEQGPPGEALIAVSQEDLGGTNAVPGNWATLLSIPDVPAGLYVIEAALPMEYGYGMEYRWNPSSVTWAINASFPGSVSGSFSGQRWTTISSIWLNGPAIGNTPMLLTGWINMATTGPLTLEYNASSYGSGTVMFQSGAFLRLTPVK